jgi:hypothetical protein
MRARVIKDWHTVYAHPLTVRAGEGLTLGRRASEAGVGEARSASLAAGFASRRDDEWTGWMWVTNAANQSGWMPERLIEVHGVAGSVRADYTARELEVRLGDILTLQIEESGWHWATASDGRSGWVPASHVVVVEVTA